MKLRPAGRWLILGFILVLAMLVVIAWSAGNPPPIAEETKAHFSDQYVQRAREYRWQSYLIYALSKASQMSLLAYLVFSPGGRGWLGSLGRRWRSRPILRVVITVLIVMLLLALVRLPWSFYQGYVLDHRYGLSNQNLTAWAMEWLLGRGIDIAMATIPIACIVPLVQRSPHRWWLPAGIVLGLGLLITTAFSPVLVDPLFFKFRPLNDPELQTRLVDMANKIGIQVEQILVADAGRKTNRANAYFTGLAGTQRIVLYDTLLTGFSKDEVAAVVAHELGHWQRRHIWKGVLLGILAIFVALFVLNRLLLTEAAANGWSMIDVRLVAHALLAVMLAGQLTLPLQNAISRSWEREADAVALQLLDQPQVAVSLWQRLAVKNLSDPQPHPWLVSLVFTHPPQLERIRAAESYSHGVAK